VAAAPRLQRSVHSVAPVEAAACPAAFLIAAHFVQFQPSLRSILGSTDRLISWPAPTTTPTPTAPRAMGGDRAGQASDGAESGPRPRSGLLHPYAAPGRHAHRRLSIRKEALAGMAQGLGRSDTRAYRGETVGRNLAGALSVSRQRPQASDHASGPCQESCGRHVQRLAGAMTDVPPRPACFEHDAVRGSRESIRTRWAGPPDRAQRPSRRCSLRSGQRRKRRPCQ
jgi:hypothetical protein